jgi:D-arabinonate dehydratase
MDRYVQMGFTAVKMKIGRLDPYEDAERVRIARETIGPKVRLAVDANNAYPDAKVAIRAARLLEPYDIWWFEEPVWPDQISAMAEIAAALDMPVAAGEIEATRWGFRQLLEAIDILQPDFTVSGGVTECIKIAHMAACFDVPIATHWMPNVNVHLVAAVSNAISAEYFLLEEDVLNFDRIVHEPVQAIDGKIQVPRTPGHGVVLDEAAVARFRIDA